MQLLERLRRSPEEKKLVALKFEPEQHALVKEKAEIYAKGNVSAWIRYASIHLEPNPEDIAGQ